MERNKVDNLKFLDDLLGTVGNDFHSILVIMVWTAEDRTGPSTHKTHNQSGLAGCLGLLGCFISLWWTMRLPTEGFIQQKQRILTWVGKPSWQIHPRLLSHSLSSLLLCLLGDFLLLKRTLPFLNYNELELEFWVPNTVSYRTKTRHTQKKELNLTRRRWIQCITSVWKEMIE